MSSGITLCCFSSSLLDSVPLHILRYHVVSLPLGSAIDARGDLTKPVTVTSSAAATKARFEQSVKEIGELKKDGPVQPSQDDKLMVSLVMFRCGDVQLTSSANPPVLRFVQASQRW